MRTVHLVVATSDIRGVVAIRSTAGWRLPRVEAPDTVSRVSLASRLRARLDRMAPADLLHWAPLPRLAPSESVDQYCVAVAHTATLTLNEHTDTVVVDRDQLLSDSILPAAERLALRTALSRLDSPVATFDSRAALVEALAWGEREFFKATGCHVETTTRYRGRRHDLVVRMEGAGTVAYLKAGWDRAHDEAALTEHLWTLRPRQFPETLAIDRQHHRWLYRELQGTPLTDSPLTQETIVAAVRALATLQTETLDAPPVVAHLANRRQTAVELFDAVDAVLERAWQSVSTTSADAPVIEVWRTMSGAMTRACTAVDTLDLPRALVLSDLSVGNILVTPDGIGFIDLLNAYWSSPILPLWRFVRDVERRSTFDDPLMQSSRRRVIVESFIDEWKGVVAPRIMLRAIAHLWLVGALFGILMASGGQDRHAEALGEELPAGFRAAGLAARVRDLLGSLGMRSVVPRNLEPDAASALDIP